MRGLKRLLVAVPLLTLATILIGLPTAALGKDSGRNIFAARLIGFDEVPSNNTNGSARLKLTVNNNTSIDFELRFQNLSGPPLFAHIHLGQSRTNGGVVVFFCGGGGKPACPSSTSGLVTGTIVPGDVQALAVQGIDPGDLAAVVRAIRADATYANIHTPKFPAGEIRGQIQRGDRNFDNQDNLDNGNPDSNNG
jgi:hypothetical protein